LRSQLRLSRPKASDWVIDYAYDQGRRLSTVSSPAGTFTYERGEPAAASSLVKRLLLPNGSCITNTFDSVARLSGSYLKSSTNSLLVQHAYEHNLAGLRTKQTFVNGNYVDYSYDRTGQLKTAYGYEAGGTTNRWQEQMQYYYDPAGNLVVRYNHTLRQGFLVDSLNQLTNVLRLTTVMPVAGGTSSAATNVTVNTSNAFLYADHTFVSTNQPLADGTNTFTAVALDGSGRSASNSVTLYLPQSVPYTYDANGNMLSDGRRHFSWDDENQLVQVILTNALKSDFVYDGKGRRRIRTEAEWDGSVWVTNAIVRYVYDGNLVVQERDGLNIPLVSYVRGTDLSGSLEGAGGIGGLLARIDHASGESGYYFADGNGNVTALVNDQEDLTATYHYDPYGNLLAMNGPLAAENLYRFSSKELHENSGLVYYLYRYYDPQLQRWPNRDPIGEPGFRSVRTAGLGSTSANLYSFVMNGPLDAVDPFGLKGCKYFCVRIGLLIPLYICAHKLQDDEDCKCLDHFFFDTVGSVDVPCLPLKFYITFPCKSDGSGPDFSTGDEPPPI